MHYHDSMPDVRHDGGFLINIMVSCQRNRLLDDWSENLWQKVFIRLFFIYNFIILACEILPEILSRLAQ